MGAKRCAAATDLQFIKACSMLHKLLGTARGGKATRTCAGKTPWQMAKLIWLGSISSCCCCCCFSSCCCCCCCCTLAGGMRSSLILSSAHYQRVHFSGNLNRRDIWQRLQATLWQYACIYIRYICNWIVENAGKQLRHFLAAGRASESGTGTARLPWHGQQLILQIQRGRGVSRGA